MIPGIIAVNEVGNQYPTDLLDGDFSSTPSLTPWVTASGVWTRVISPAAIEHDDPDSFEFGLYINEPFNAFAFNKVDQWVKSSGAGVLTQNISLREVDAEFNSDTESKLKFKLEWFQMFSGSVEIEWFDSGDGSLGTETAANESYEHNLWIHRKLEGDIPPDTSYLTISVIAAAVAAFDAFTWDVRQVDNTKLNVNFARTYVILR